MVRNEILIPVLSQTQEKIRKSTPGTDASFHELVNFLVVGKPPPGTSEDDLKPLEKQGLAKGLEWYKFGLSYALEHGFKTSTIGLVLASNPLALMAW
jgi:hypothetical protein